jgi:putative transposase
MECVKILPLKHLTHFQHEQIWAARLEAGKAWNQCRDIHLEARQTSQAWPNRTQLQEATKGRFAIHSQSVQMICHTFLQNIDTTRQLRKSGVKIRYPYKTKRAYFLMWPAQAVKIKNNRVILPMGRGRESLVLNLKLPEGSGACKLVFNDGYELHVTYHSDEAQESPGNHRACIDLGEIHQAAVSTDTGHAIVVSGRGIRTLKRQRSKALGEIAQKRSRCKKGSKRYRKLQKTRRKISKRYRQRIRDLRHKGTRKVIDFCITQQVGSLFVGNPHGIREKKSNRKHNQRMSNWEYGRDIQYIKEKSVKAGIQCFAGSERGTSSQCPECSHRQKPKGRQWKCRKCGFSGHRDVVGSVNMHPIAFNTKIGFPQRITYLRPGYLSQRRSSSLDTGQSCQDRLQQQKHYETGQQSCLRKSEHQPPVTEQCRSSGASQETGQRSEVA